ncbi:MAG: BTB/POZ domain-containing protein, partial [Planctomycetota bacterium]
MPSTVLQQKLSCYDEVFHNIQEMKKEDCLTDITLSLCDGSEIRAHRVILAAGSPYFKVMFTSGFKEAKQNVIQLPSLAPDAVNTIVDMLYTMKLPRIKQSNVESLLLAASFLQVTAIVNHCANFMVKNLHASNCLETLQLITIYGSKSAEAKCLRFIDKSFEKCSKTESFLALDKETFQTIITRQRLAMPTVKVILTSVLDWVRHDSELRKEALPHLLNRIHLHSLPSEYIENEILTDELILENELCKKLVSQAISHQQTCAARP